MMSHTEKSLPSKEDVIKKKKRKFRLKSDESSSYDTSKVLKRALCSYVHSEPDIPQFLYYRSTKDYTQVDAEPALLPDTPNIFQTNKSKNDKPNTSDSFLFNLLSPNSLNTNISERFYVKNFSNNEKQKKKKIKKEKTEEEKVRRYLKNKAKKENKIKKKQELKKAVALQQNESENNTAEEDENVINKVDIYRVPEKKVLVFHMHHPSKFSFQGEFKITIITGEVEVLGYTLSSSSANSINIYSPNFYTPLIVETKVVKQEKPMEEILVKLKDHLTESNYSTLCKNLKPEHSVLLVEQIKSSFGIVINKYFDLPIFSKDVDDVFLMTDALKNLRSIFTFKFSKNGKHYRKNSEWDRIPLGQCTTLLGGKGVGKSTLLKYYINKFITLKEKVLCLDFDPGQPEFSFPGCVSAVVIDQPVIGPNFTHVIDPILLLYFGDVDVCPNPTKYLESVKYIIEYCKKNEDLLKMKWFVNTMGFCKGLGVNLMISILKLLKPDTVIQIKSSDYKNNYPFYMNPGTVNCKSGFRSMPLDDVTVSYDLRVIYSFAEIKKKPLQGGLKQRQLRDIMSLSYFSKAVSPPFYNFNAVQPHLIPFSELYLGIDFFIDPNDVLKAFNGNTVSLSHFEPDTEEIFSVASEEDVYFKVVIKPRIGPSLGIGFVRGIDCKEKKIYILTHLKLDSLSQVNCLTLGRVCAPHAMFLKQEAVESQTVYTTSGAQDVIHRVRRMFRVPCTPQIQY